MFMVTIISSLLSGIVGVLISTFYYRRYEKRKAKFDTLQRFSANRFDLKGDPFSRTLNEIFVIFYDSPKVISALSNYHAKVSNGENSEDELVRLFKSMCENLYIKYEQLNDSFFLRPFNTKPDCKA